MHIVLTNSTNSLKILVNLNLVKLIEPNPTAGTDIVFDAGLVRVVTETIAQIEAVVGATVP